MHVMGPRHRGIANSNQPGRILITARFHGGVGGAERAVYSMLRALDPYRVDVVVRELHGGPLSVVPDGVRVYTRRNWRWVGSAARSGVKGLVSRMLNAVRRSVLPRYDLHIAISGGPDVTGTTRSGLRVFNPAGVTMKEPSPLYDLFILEAPDNVSMVSDVSRAILLPPPYYPLADVGEAPAVALPDEFMLTVFNPYWAVKGVDDLREALKTAPCPIVWCHSDRTVGFTIPADLLDHPGVIHVVDATKEELRFLYERCKAFLCFSRSEGFGWAITDALHLSPAVVSRSVGVLSFEEARLPGVFPVSRGRWRFDWRQLATSTTPKVPRALSWLAPQRFRKDIDVLIAGDIMSDSTHLPRLEEQ